MTTYLRAKTGMHQAYVERELCMQNASSGYEDIVPPKDGGEEYVGFPTPVLGG